MNNCEFLFPYLEDPGLSLLKLHKQGDLVGSPTLDDSSFVLPSPGRLP